MCMMYWFQLRTQTQQTTHLKINNNSVKTAITSVMNEQHNDLVCTKQDQSHTSRYVDESLPEQSHDMS